MRKSFNIIFDRVGNNDKLRDMKHYHENLFLVMAIILLTFQGYSQDPDKRLLTGSWSVQEKELLIQGLERTRSELLNEIKAVSERQWTYKEDSTRWSIAEIVEHLFAQNESFRIELRTVLNQPELAQFMEKAKGNDRVFIDYATDTLRADAGFLSPIGRFCSKEKATFAFNRTHDALINMVSTSNKDFRKHFTFRNYVSDGHLSNAEKYNVRDMHQVMLTCIAHMDRHLNQLRRIKKHPGYPKSQQGYSPKLQ